MFTANDVVPRLNLSTPFYIEWFYCPWFSQGILSKITRDLKLDHCGDESSVVQSCG